MFVIVNHAKKFFIKPDYFAIQSFAMVHSYKWSIAEVLSGKKQRFISSVAPCYNKL